MKKIFPIIFILLFILSCRDARWEAVSTNKFLSENHIDTTDYNTFDNLYLKGKVGKIVIPDTIGYPLHFDEPRVAYNEGFVFIEKNLPNNNKNVIVKLNLDGEAVDSIVINKSAKIVNDCIIENGFYLSWFIDGDKEIKKIKDEINLNDGDANQFSNNIRQIALKNSKALFTVEDFFAKSHKKFIPGNQPEKPKFYIHGGGGDPCEIFYGTYFITKLTNPDFKLKIMNQSVCDHSDYHDLSVDYRFYTEDFLNFYMIDKGYNAPGNRVFYIVKK